MLQARGTVQRSLHGAQAPRQSEHLAGKQNTASVRILSRCKHDRNKPCALSKLSNHKEASDNRREGREAGVQNSMLRCCSALRQPQRFSRCRLPDHLRAAARARSGSCGGRRGRNIMGFDHLTVWPVLCLPAVSMLVELHARAACGRGRRRPPGPRGAPRTLAHPRRVALGVSLGALGGTARPPRGRRRGRLVGT